MNCHVGNTLIKVFPNTVTADSELRGVSRRCNRQNADARV